MDERVKTAADKFVRAVTQTGLGKWNLRIAGWPSAERTAMISLVESSKYVVMMAGERFRGPDNSLGAVIVASLPAGTHQGNHRRSLGRRHPEFAIHFPNQFGLPPGRTCRRSLHALVHSSDIGAVHTHLKQVAAENGSPLTSRVPFPEPRRFVALVRNHLPQPPHGSRHRRDSSARPGRYRSHRMESERQVISDIVHRAEPDRQPGPAS